MPLSPDDLEHVWSDLATALDAVPAERRALFLTKLALALAHEISDPRAVAAAIELAGRSLVASDGRDDAFPRGVQPPSMNEVPLSGNTRR